MNFAAPGGGSAGSKAGRGGSKARDEPRLFLLTWTEELWTRLAPVLDTVRLFDELSSADHGGHGVPSDDASFDYADGRRFTLKGPEVAPGFEGRVDLGDVRDFLLGSWEGGLFAPTGAQSVISRGNDSDGS